MNLVSPACMCVCIFISIECSKSVEIMGVPETHKKWRLCELGWHTKRYDCGCLYEHPHCLNVFSVGIQHFQKLLSHWQWVIRYSRVSFSKFFKPTPIHYKKAYSCYEVGEGGEKRHVETELFIHFHSFGLWKKKSNKEKQKINTEKI